jgi:hypothetical protein
MSIAETEVVAPPASGALARVASPTPRPLRLLPAPSSEPPYDDELPHPRLVPVDRAAPDVVLPLPSLPRTTPAAVPGRPLPGAPLPALRLVPAGDDLDDEWDDASAHRTPLAQLPAARPFAHALVQRLLEVLAGLRPVSQLQRDTTFELFDALERTVVGRPRAAGVRPTLRDVRSVHVQEREDGVAEVCATVRRNGRATALALRLEGVDGAWRCTALDGV